MFKGSYLFQTIILGIHVSFRGCNSLGIYYECIIISTSRFWSINNSHQPSSLLSPCDTRKKGMSTARKKCHKEWRKLHCSGVFDFLSETTFQQKSICLKWCLRYSKKHSNLQKFYEPLWTYWCSSFFNSLKFRFYLREFMDLECPMMLLFFLGGGRPAPRKAEESQQWQCV